MVEEARREEDKRAITIKGVDSELYDKISELARLKGRTIGDIVSQAFKLYLSLLEAGGKVISFTESVLSGIKKKVNVQLIKDIEKLEVDRALLEEAESLLLFVGIKELVFSDDVTQELFDEKVGNIVDCRLVEIPRSLSKLKALKKCRFIGELRTRAS